MPYISHTFYTLFIVNFVIFIFFWNQLYKFENNFQRKDKASTRSTTWMYIKFKFYSGIILKDLIEIFFHTFLYMFYSKRFIFMFGRKIMHLFQKWVLVKRYSSSNFTSFLYIKFKCNIGIILKTIIKLVFNTFFIHFCIIVIVNVCYF